MQEPVAGPVIDTIAERPWGPLPNPPVPGRTGWATAPTETPGARPGTILPSSRGTRTVATG